MPTPVIVAHVTVDEGGQAQIPVPAGWTAAYTVVAGQVDIANERTLVPGDTVVFEDDGESLVVSSKAKGEVLLMCGEPIGEPIFMGFGAVTTSKRSLERAFADYHAGRYGSLESSR